MNSTILYIFSNCFFSQGAFRVLVFDSQHDKLVFIPNSLYEFINTFEGKTENEIYSNFTIDEHKIVKQYIDYILKNLIGAFLPKESIGSFTPFHLSYSSPYLFENAIIDIEDNLVEDVSAVLIKLDKTNIPHIQLRFMSEVSPYYDVLSLIESLSFFSVSVIASYDKTKLENIKEFKKISSVFLYNSPESIVYQSNKKLIHLHKTNSYKCYGMVDPKYFSLNSIHFCQSQKYNTCLYKKLFIGKSGEIRNCPKASIVADINQITDIELRKLADSPLFTQYWNITKDTVEVCRDCEFRHICTDCRYVVKDPTNCYSQPANCGYNPYIAKWNDEEGYVPVEECGSYSVNTGFVPDKEKIAIVIKNSWNFQ